MPLNGPFVITHQELATLRLSTPSICCLMAPGSPPAD
jgi:hypothetical protein